MSKAKGKQVTQQDASLYCKMDKVSRWIDVMDCRANRKCGKCKEDCLDYKRSTSSWLPRKIKGEE